MTNYQQKKIIHLHNPRSRGISGILSYDCIILGSAFCELCRIDRNMVVWEEIIDRIKKKGYRKKIYVQQPFYLIGDEEHEFLCAIRELINCKMINGILINSPGIARRLSKNSETNRVEIIFSRYGIRKRRRTNKYLIDQLLEYNVKAFECFNKDIELINDLNLMGNRMKGVELWIRMNPNCFHSFSRTCFISLYNNQCINDPGNCSSGNFNLNNKKKNINLIISGHLIYNGKNKKNSKVLKFCDAIITNAGENEL